MGAGSLVFLRYNCCLGLLWVGFVEARERGLDGWEAWGRWLRWGWPSRSETTRGSWSIASPRSGTRLLAAAFKGVCGVWGLLYTGILGGLGGAWFGLVSGAGIGLGLGSCASIIDFKGGVVRSLPRIEISLCPVLFTSSSVLCNIFRAVSQSLH